jgi:SAM-dependent methyltransferase
MPRRGLTRFWHSYRAPDTMHQETLRETRIAISAPAATSTMTTGQIKQPEWTWQWEHAECDNEWLFREWIHPLRLEDLAGRDVLDCGCGGGQHLLLMSPHCRSATGVDLNAASAALRNTRSLANVEVLEGDLATMDLGRAFDVVMSIGVLHHTDDPAASFRNIARHCRPGGRVVVWVYSREGNFWNRTLVEWVRRTILRRLPRAAVWRLSQALTALLSIPIHTIYRLPLRFLPFWEYFQNWRRLPFSRNALNVFDKLNAPQTHFLSRCEVASWYRPEEFCDVHISPYVGVSWRASGTRRDRAEFPDRV